MKFIIVIITCILLCGIIACDDNPTYEPIDDNMALVGITRDNPVLFETKLVNTDIPDTTLPFISSDFIPLFYWREITGSGRKYTINAFYPDTNSLIEVPEATVTITDTIKTDFHVIANDTTADPDTLVRFIDSVIELVFVSSKMEKWGSQYDPRNGWLLMEISGASGRTPNLYDAISRVSLSSISLGDKEYISSSFEQTRSLDQIENVIRNELITITVQVIDSTDIVTFHVGKNEYTKVVPDYIGNRRFEGNIVAPNERGYFHITIDVIRKSHIAVQGAYDFRRLSMLFYATDR